MSGFNSGRQIKVLAVILFLIVLGAGCYLSYTFACACNTDSSGPEPKVFAIGIVIFVIGGYLSALFVYAFGALVDSSIETEYNTRRLLKEQKKMVAMLEEEPDTPSPDMMRP